MTLQLKFIAIYEKHVNPNQANIPQDCKKKCIKDSKFQMVQIRIL